MKNLTSFSLNSLKKFFSYGERIRPARDWYLLLAIAGVLLVLGIGWNIFLFNELENGMSLETVADLPQHQVIGNSITAVQAVFQKRAAEEDKYQSVYHFVDPSLPGS